MNTTSSNKTLLKVIGASSVGTMIEWYDFFIFGSLAAIISSNQNLHNPKNLQYNIFQIFPTR